LVRCVALLYAEMFTCVRSAVTAPGKMF